VAESGGARLGGLLASAGSSWLSLWLSSCSVGAFGGRPYLLVLALAFSSPYGCRGRPFVDRPHPSTRGEAGFVWAVDVDATPLGSS